MCKLLHTAMILGLAVFTGCAREGAKTEPPQGQTAKSPVFSSKLQEDLALLCQHNQHKYNASPSIFAAARRVFSDVRFEGLSKQQVKELLGQPVEVSERDGKTVWDYMYHDGEQGVHRRIWFDADGIRVVRVEVIPTQ